MEYLAILEARLGRWLAYADYCISNEHQLARCQPFWGFVAILLGVICAAAAAGVIWKVLRDRRARAAGGGYTPPRR